MRKSIITLSLLSCCLFLHSSQSDDNLLFVNQNNVAVYQSRYNLLKKIGYTDREIDNLNQIEYDKFNNIQIKETSSSNYLLNQNQLKMKLNDTSQSSNYEKDGINLNVYGTWYKKNNSNDDYVYVKVTSEFKNTTGLKDYIGIIFGSDVQADYTINNGSQRPKFTSKLLYDHYHYYKYEDDYGKNNTEEEWTKSESVSNTNNDLDSYLYTIDRGLFTFYKLPENKNVKHDGGDEYLHNKYTIIETYTNFLMTLEAEFKFKSNDHIRTSFKGAYGRQESGELAAKHRFSIELHADYIKVTYAWYEAWGNRAKYKELSTGIFLE